MFPEGRAVEFLVAAIVALIVVGPKDLPVLLRKLGQFMAKVRAMAAEFRASFDEMARQSELDELRKEVEAMRQGQLTDLATHAPEVNQAFDEISQGLSDVGVSLNAPSSYPTVAAEPTMEIKPMASARKRKGPAAKAPANAGAAKKPTAKKVTAPKTAAKASGKSVAKSKAPVVQAPITKSPAAKRPIAKSGAKVAPAKSRARKALVS